MPSPTPLSSHRARPRPRGFVLVTIALLLVVVAGLGAAAMRSASTQERIAGVFYDRALALSSSESALSDAKEYLLDPAFDASDSSMKVRDGSPLFSNATGDGFTVYDWISAGTNWLTGTFAMLLGRADGNTNALARVKNAPGYIVDRFPDMGITPTTKFQVFRVTARGAGGRDENAAYTQVLSRVPVSTGS